MTVHAERCPEFEGVSIPFFQSPAGGLRGFEDLLISKLQRRLPLDPAFAE